MVPGSVSHIRRDLDIGQLRENKLEQILNTLVENVDLDAIDTNALDLVIQNGYEAGEHFTNFLKTVGKVIVDRRMARTIKIDRKTLFNPVQFMDHQGLEIEEQDERSVMLEAIDLSTIALQSMLLDETVIRGEEHLKRLKGMGHIRLDAGIFKTLWENQHIIPEHWKGNDSNPNHIFFDGTVLRNEYGRYVISMYWDVKKWNWTYCRLDIGGWKSEDLSAVIKCAEPLHRIERRRHMRVM
jgi:hypothetical protein